MISDLQQRSRAQFEWFLDRKPYWKSYRIVSCLKLVEMFEVLNEINYFSQFRSTIRKQKQKKKIFATAQEPFLPSPSPSLSHYVTIWMKNQILILDTLTHIFVTTTSTKRILDVISQDALPPRCFFSSSAAASFNMSAASLCMSSLARATACM